MTLRSLTSAILTARKMFSVSFTASAVLVDDTVTTPLPRVQGNLAALTQIISNLLGNAVKFVEKGVKPEVRIWAEVLPGRSEVGSPAPASGRVRLWFEDNGLGIAPEHHPRIFQMFQRLHHLDQFEGTGVGLAIVRKAVERMGGRAGVESAVGQGSRFWIELKPADALPAPAMTQP